MRPKYPESLCTPTHPTTRWAVACGSFCESRAIAARPPDARWCRCMTALFEDIRLSCCFGVDVSAVAGKDHLMSGIANASDTHQGLLDIGAPLVPLPGPPFRHKCPWMCCRQRRISPAIVDTDATRAVVHSHPCLGRTPFLRSPLLSTQVLPPRYNPKRHGCAPYASYGMPRRELEDHGLLVKLETVQPAPP